MTTFTLNNNTFTTNESGTYFYMIDTNGKKIRIKKAEYEQAQREYEYFTSRIPEGTDLYNPAVIDPEYGCVDCSQCNVKNCVHRDCMRRNPVSYGGLAECPRLAVVIEEPKEEPAPKAKKRTRKSKDVAQTFDIEDQHVTLTAKQVDFIRHLPDTYFWEEGLESTIWVDCLCDDIQGQFAGKPMTVGAMISTICEKGLGVRTTDRRENKKCVAFTLTELGRRVAYELGVC